jgi:hypothetical protein
MYSVSTERAKALKALGAICFAAAGVFFLICLALRKRILYATRSSFIIHHDHAPIEPFPSLHPSYLLSCDHNVNDAMQ